MSFARLRRDARLLVGYVERAFLGALGWRTFMLTLVVQAVVPPLVGLAVWTQALPDRPEVATYFTVLLFVRLLTVCYEPHTFLNNIYDGTLTHGLLLPRPVVLGVLGENLAWRLWHVVMALPLLVAVGLLTTPRVAPADLALALPAMLLAAALRFVYTYLLVLAAFWTQRAQSIAGAGSLLVFLLGGEAAPIPLLPEAYRPLVAVLPFRAMIGFPAEVAAGLARGPELLVGYLGQLAWLAVLALLAAQVWRVGVRRYTAFGG
jgi:ABC-2 type transport system permease protein